MGTCVHVTMCHSLEWNENRESVVGMGMENAGVFLFVCSTHQGCSLIAMSGLN